MDRSFKQEGDWPVVLAEYQTGFQNATAVPAIPDSLFEAELFGHLKGTFTDAQENRIGLAETADGGTLFLDEIGDAGPASQPKLLTFLEERRFRRLGGREDLEVDVRIVATRPPSGFSS